MADLDCSACLPAAVHTLWLDAVLLEIEHLVDVRPRFRSDTHHIEKCPVITVVHSAFHHIFQKEITVSRITEFNISPKRPPFLDLTELGRHQLVKLGIAWELVYKRHKGVANFE